MQNSFAYDEVANNSAVKYLTGVKEACFSFQLKTSCISNHTDEL